MSYVIKGQEEKVLKLKKVLFGLKEGPRACNSHIDKYFQYNRFVHCQYEYALYVKKIDNSDMFLVIPYEFEMTDIELMSYYLGLKVK
ncbi:hypothetical protein CR513_54164, partial [Mucuna pruriens]